MSAYNRGYEDGLREARAQTQPRGSFLGCLVNWALYASAFLLIGAALLSLFAPQYLPYFGPMPNTQPAAAPTAIIVRTPVPARVDVPRVAPGRFERLAVPTPAPVAPAPPAVAPAPAPAPLPTQPPLNIEPGLADVVAPMEEVSSQADEAFLDEFLAEPEAPVSAAPVPAPPGGVAPDEVSSQANEEFLCEFIGEC